MITKDQILKTAKQARIELSEEEVGSFAPRFGSILEYVSSLDAVDVSGVEPMCFMGYSRDPFRDDVEVPSLTPEQVLGNGPSVKKGHFAVPKVIG